MFNLSGLFHRFGYERFDDLILFNADNKGVYCLFLGSGISRKAGIPTGWEIITDQIGKIAALQQEEIAGTPEEWYFNKYQKLPDYSDILELLTNTPAERVNALKAYFEPNAEELEEGLKTPTIAHCEIAKLIKSGIVKVVVTTNFDRLLQHALNDEGIEPVVISNPTHVENTQPIVHNPITIVKVNGDYLDTRFLNIKSELTGYDPRIGRLLSEIFENFGLITCGWSAAWDIALVDLLKAANKFRYSNYFTYRGTPSPEWRNLPFSVKVIYKQSMMRIHFLKAWATKLKLLHSCNPVIHLRKNYHWLG